MIKWIKKGEKEWRKPIIWIVLRLMLSRYERRRERERKGLVFKHSSRGSCCCFLDIQFSGNLWCLRWTFVMIQVWQNLRVTANIAVKDIAAAAGGALDPRKGSDNTCLDTGKPAGWQLLAYLVVQRRRRRRRKVLYWALQQQERLDALKEAWTKDAQQRTTTMMIALATTLTVATRAMCQLQEGREGEGCDSNKKGLQIPLLCWQVLSVSATLVPGFRQWVAAEAIRRVLQRARFRHLNLIIRALTSSGAFKHAWIKFLPSDFATIGCSLGVVKVYTRPVSDTIRSRICVPVNVDNSYAWEKNEKFPMRTFAPLKP